MPTSSDAQHLDATLNALNDGVTALSPAAARGTIERWLNVLADHQDLNDVATALGELRAALAATPIDGAEVGRILTRLGARTTEAAEDADDALASKLDRLGGMLSQAGRALGRGRATMPPQAGTAEEDGVVQTNSEAAGPMPQGSRRQHERRARRRQIGGGVPDTGDEARPQVGPRKLIRATRSTADGHTG